MSSAGAALADQRGLVVLGVRWWVVRLPLVTPLHHAAVHVDSLESVVVRVDVSEADGTSPAAATWTGHAEVRSNGAYATHERRDDITAALGRLDVTGRDLGSVVDAAIARSRLAAMALDVAGWAALGQARGLPVARLLSDSAAPVLRTHGPVGFGTVAEAATVARRHVDAGLRRLKVRVGSPDLDGDLARVAAVRAVCGPERTVIVDANGGWSEEAALAALGPLAALRVSWLEQPVRDRGGLGVITRAARALPPGSPGNAPAGSLRIRADESATDAGSVTALAGLVDGVHLKLEKAGTVERLAAAVGAARDAGLAVALGQMDQGRLGCAATAHIAAGLGIDDVEFWGWSEVAEDVAGPLDLVDGALTLPTAPGLGVAVTLPDVPEGLIA